MALKFKIGDKVKAICTSPNSQYRPYKKGDVGKVVGGAEQYLGTAAVCKVAWPTHLANGYDFWYTPLSNIVYLSVIYSEDHLKEKDIL